MRQYYSVSNWRGLSSLGEVPKSYENYFKSDIDQIQKNWIASIMLLNLNGIKMDKLSEELKEQVKSERRFLHDISNHILVAHGMATLVQRALQDNPNVNAAELDRLEKSIDALRKMTEELHARRKILHSI